MKVTIKHLAISILMVLMVGFFENAICNDLIIVADKTAQEASVSWFDFLETKEIPFEVVTPEDFGNYKKNSYIVIIGSIENTEEIRKISKNALSAGELKSMEGEKRGEAFFKSNVWAPRQKVILFLGTDQADADAARKASKDYWYGMFQDWFDIEGTEGLHFY